jgi:hypothetical protein
MVYSVGKRVLLMLQIIKSNRHALLRVQIRQMGMSLHDWVQNFACEQQISQFYDGSQFARLENTEVVEFACTHSYESIFRESLIIKLFKIAFEASF